MEPTVERQADIDATPEEVWAALGEPGAWLADEGSLDLRPGGEGRLVDDGVARRAVVETVEEGSRLVYRWWDERGGEADASRVEIRVLPSEGPTRVVVRETRLGAGGAVASAVARSPLAVRMAGARRTRATLRWEVRLTCLAVLCARVRV
jgi:uncharacterized protein YndB with AHSA1/START domain